MRTYALALIALVASLVVALPAAAASREVRIPLRDGRFRVADLVAALPDGFPMAARIRSFAAGEINVAGIGGSLAVRAFNAAMGDGCRLSATADAVVLTFEVASLPSPKAAVRTFVAQLNPQAGEQQRQRLYGLKLPDKLDDRKPLLVLVHGLYTWNAVWGSFAAVAEKDGQQVALYGYPSGQAIDKNATDFGAALEALRRDHPTLRVHLVTHSLGGLVARAYIESDAYKPGLIDRLIMIAPPNQGSPWAKFSTVIALRQQYYLRKYCPDWDWSWAVAETLTDSSAQIEPGSPFLRALNARPRRDGVRYTIIAGTKNEIAEMAGGTLSGVAGKLGRFGAKYLQDKIAAAETSLEAGATDGVVSLDSTRLAGVPDYVPLPAGHNALVMRWNGADPAAWPTIKDRLAKN